MDLAMPFLLGPPGANGTTRSQAINPPGEACPALAPSQGSLPAEELGRAAAFALAVGEGAQEARQKVHPTWSHGEELCVGSLSPEGGSCVGFWAYKGSPACSESHLDLLGRLKHSPGLPSMGGKHGENHQALLSEGEEAEMEIFGYKTHGFRKALCIAGSVLSCGVLLLVFYWKPAWDVWASCVPCDLQEADVVLLRTTDEFHTYSRKKVTWTSLTDICRDSTVVADGSSLLNRVVRTPELNVRCIQVQKIRYAWDLAANCFQKVGVLEDSHTCADVHAKFGSGLASKEREVRKLICGPNTIDVEITPIWKLLVTEVLHPFYVFQLFSVCLWLAEDYIEYSVAIVLMSLLSVALTVYDLRMQSVKLHHLVESHNSVPVKVCRRQADVQAMESRHLVPGDLLVLEGGRLMLPCDAILLSGVCIVNEGMLTGESIPVTKTSLPRDNGEQPWQASCAGDHRRHILFCGTEIIQAKGDGWEQAKAVVLRTGFNTAKGDLVRSILYPKPMNFRLYRDAIRFLMFLIGIAGIGMVYTVCVFVLNGEAGEVVKKALDVVTIAVPPALPAALTTGIIYTQRRLKKKGIFCISPQRINVCGQLNLVCFDKTGTLTEDGLDLWGLVLAKGQSFQNVCSLASGSPIPWGLPCGAMVCCHSLVLLEGKIQGDPLDLKMFEATHWELEDPKDHGGAAGELTHTMVVKPGPKAVHVPVEGMVILHQFPFSSALQRMSVVVQEFSGGRHVFMKGAPERVAHFCRPESVPPTFASHLQLYASRGFRILGLAHKAWPEGVPTTSLVREEVESHLTFLGFLVLENRLKRETRPVLEELTAARIRSVMVTGDNLQTAITVAREAGLILQGSQVILVEAGTQPGHPAASVTWKLLEESSKDTGPGPKDLHSAASEGGGRPFHFCMSGGSYEVIAQSFSHLLPKLLLNGTVFARMSPAQKASLVQEFQKMDYFVGMCGDGANDCGALKVAHAGISLSEQEASVASPFTSRTPNVECVPELIRQGRAALVTSFCMFKYMALYSIIQYLGVLLLYWKLNSFGNYQFLFQDLAITTLIGMTMSLNGASPKLVPFRPAARLTSPPLLLSVVLNILFSLALQVCGFVLVQQQPWYSADNLLSACSPGNTSHAGAAGNATRSSNSSGSEEAKDDYRSYENTTVWLLGTINCLLVAVVFSKGKPFQQPVHTNYVFVVTLAVQLAVCLFFLFAHLDELYARMELVCTPLVWRIALLVMLTVTFALSFTVEEVVIENRALWGLLKRGLGYQSSSSYQRLRRAVERDSAWPPLGRTDFSESVALSVGCREAYTNPVFESHEEPRSGHHP
ncbi:putative cation-transporting ATPase 13A4 isoform X2 [Paroedura picta]|uniref:putative cation-transporting ATPase 13A4 isoform X2 n=1 Tax=Paroedura picta TaxID=143630 RepID=UPI0040563E9F